MPVDQVFIRRFLPMARVALALGFSSVLLAGCIVVPARSYDGGYAYQDAAVAVAPPAPQQEYMGVAPVAGYLWIGGYWNWAGSRHVWVGGHWEAPRAGYRWAPHTWVRAHDGWHARPGHWEKAR